jgi:hypothetical protein
VALAQVGACFGNEPFVFGQQDLYFNPLHGRSEDGFWHKDLLKAQPIHEWPDARDTETGPSLHVQEALLPSDHLEIVPGSHRRDYSAVEAGICLPYPNGPNIRSNAMPGGCTAVLAPGDALIFSATAIHRGRYHADSPRRT